MDTENQIGVVEKSVDTPGTLGDHTERSFVTLKPFCADKSD